MSERTIFLLEDIKAMRQLLDIELQDIGFKVIGADGADSARKRFAEGGFEIDVAILDMLLFDPTRPGPHGDPTVTGAEIGEELKGRQALSPEFVIFSAYPKNEFYRQAMKLRAAVFVPKEDDHSIQELLRHVRILSIRRAMSMKRPECFAAIQTIAERSHNSYDAMDEFVKSKLVPELQHWLGAHFFLLATRPDGGESQPTQLCGSSLDLPETAHTSYDRIARLTFSQSTPIPITPGLLFESIIAPEEAEMFPEMEDLVVLALAKGENVHLTLGICPGTGEDDPKALAEVVSQHLSFSLFENLERISEILAKSSAERRALLSAAADFCLHIGDEQLAIVDDAFGSEDPKPHLERLQALGENLRDTGDVLTELLEPGDYKREPVNIRELIDEIWEQLRELTVFKDENILSAEGSCVVQAVRVDLEIAISRILRWMAFRTLETTKKVGRHLRVVCRTTDDRVQVVLEDTSPRLRRHLREHLFEPFAVSEDGGEISIGSKGRGLGLYLAKTLVEVRNGGSIEDKTDEMEGRLGQRLVLSFSASGGNTGEPTP